MRLGYQLLVPFLQIHTVSNLARLTAKDYRLTHAFGDFSEKSTQTRTEGRAGQMLSIFSSRAAVIVADIATFLSL